MLNWTTWNRTFWHWNCVLMLNWIVWNSTVFDFETAYLCWTELFEIELFWHLTVCGENLFLYWSELFKLDLFKLEQFDSYE